MKKTGIERLWETVLVVMSLLYPLGILSAVCFVKWGKDQYKTLIEAEEQAIPKFVELNEAVLRELPPPDGIEITRRYNGDFRINTSHGVALHINYGDIDGKKIQVGRVMAYYELLLSQRGWVRDRLSDCSGLYYRDTSCVEVSFPCGRNEWSSYDISIWHDFEHQEFSPKLPPLWLVNLLEFGETRILICPPPGAIP